MVLVRIDQRSFDRKDDLDVGACGQRVGYSRKPSEW